MVRAKITGGNLTPGQFRRLGTLAETFGDGSLRLTMRQGLQLHGIVPGEPAAVIAELESMAVTTRGSCGNSLRNVTCCPLPSDSEETLWARQLAARIANRWLPRAAWVEWVVRDEQEWVSRPLENQTVEHDAGYERGYLPHKWKIGVAAGLDNCINVLANDLGMRVRKGIEGKALVDLFVGGSLAYRTGKANVGSVPRLAQPLGTVFPDQVDAIVEALMELHREVTGEGSQSRSQRHFRRLKYVVERLGTESIAAWVGQRTGIEWVLPSIDVPAIHRWNQHSGWLRDSSGTWSLTIPVVGGRMRIADGWLRLAEVAQSLAVGPGHTLVLRGVADVDVAEVQKIAESLGATVGTPGSLPVLASPKRVLTCVALPTCPLAIAESERDEKRWRLAANEITGQLAKLCSRSLNQYSLTQRLPGDLRVAVSGCSNGCSHPLCAELGIVAESSQQFRVFVGGNGVELGISVGVIEGPGWLAEFVRGLYRRYLVEKNLEETGWDWLVRTF